MDNRLRFLYFVISEMWGHRDKAWAGNGKTGASGVAVWEENPPCKAKPGSGANIRVAKHVEQLSGKAAIKYYGPVP